MGETRDNDADEEDEEKASDFVTANVDGKATRKLGTCLRALES
ncbi:hypothetical protein COLO4_07251 [Corchorus olitorius]|uniref:Uncharacterized protein n=1 Tax=Corchorus olitorius TaxID=93759 RepID=A0A1R3KKC5_9ROSI|nr:hypothetical protein COLO4_07251 [Corchorus olitorius]